MTRYTVTILPEGIRIVSDTPRPFSEILAQSGIPMSFPCGGEARCGGCMVRVEGDAPPPTHEETKALLDTDIAAGGRLACRLVVTGDMTVEVPLSSRVAGMEKGWEEVRVVSDISLRPEHPALAVDLGTTSIAVALVDEKRGEILAHASALNPQAAFGADVISRINAVIKDPENLTRQQRLVTDVLIDLAVKLTARFGIAPADIRTVTLAGNPTMEHLALGIDPRPIASAPFVPAFREAMRIDAVSLGLSFSRGAFVWAFPLLSGYVGGDTLAFIWSSKIYESREMLLGLDIGTNGEIVLGNRDRIITCSTAAGPAFEGSHIRDGMRADLGAIEGVSIDDESVTLSVKGDATPRGICGSGLLDAVAQMRKTGILDTHGRITGNGVPEGLSRRIRRDRGTAEFSLFRDEAVDIGITQKDIREIQLAKGAMRAGCEVLINEMGIGWKDIDRVLIAGAFGNYLKGESLVGAGLLPPSLLNRIFFVGDAALTGAISAALSSSARRGIERISTHVGYLELSSDRRFNDYFMSGLMFKEPEL
jgi:uncharacterized 2Fe-2S/4Fe-4S cluster protein (DUF4445 family)